MLQLSRHRQPNDQENCSTTNGSPQPAIGATRVPATSRWSTAPYAAQEGVQPNPTLQVSRQREMTPVERSFQRISSRPASLRCSTTHREQSVQAPLMLQT